MVRRQVCIQHMCNGGLGMPDLDSHWLAERLAYLDRSLTRESASAERPFITFLGPVTFHGLKKSYIRS